jgi:hypothetical protein
VNRDVSSSGVRTSKNKKKESIKQLVSYAKRNRSTTGKVTGMRWKLLEKEFENTKIAIYCPSYYVLYQL